MRYKAFISYSHAADGKLAPAIQRGLERFTRSWYQTSAMRVFRDETNLSASPGLWSSIEAALGDSDFFLLLVSPQAAASKWVSKEVGYWLDHRSAETLLLICTEGVIVWDAERGGFSWSSTIPEKLRAAYREEPNWVDLRWAKNESALSLDNPKFLDKVADLVATLLRRNKDELVGDNVHQQKRARRLTASGISALVLLTFLSVTVAFWANHERKVAVQQQAIAESRQLKSQKTKRGHFKRGNEGDIFTTRLPSGENPAARTGPLWWRTIRS